MSGVSTISEIPAACPGKTFAFQREPVEDRKTIQAIKTTRIPFFEILVCSLFCLFGLPLRSAPAQESAGEKDVIPVQDLRADGNDDMRYFLIGAPAGGGVAKGKNKEKPGLVLVLPGGNGNAEFLGFVKNIYKNVLAGRYLVAELVSVERTAGRHDIWPTRFGAVEGREFMTERFIAAVVDDVSARHDIDDSRVFTLSWSSGGPAAYAASLQEETPVRGAYVAMSVFTPRGLPLDAAAGHAFFLDQSPQDKKCFFWHAVKAKEVLHRHGAATRLVSYEGGHGWFGDVFGRLRTGFEWLEKETAGKSVSAKSRRPRKTKWKYRPGGNLLFNGGFEMGLDGWTVANNSGRMEVFSDGKERKEGKKSLRVKKTGGPPFDLLRNDLYDLPPTKKITLSARVKAKSAGRAILKFFLYDEKGTSLTSNVDVHAISGSRARWKTIERTFDLPGEAVSASVMLLMIQEGTVWLDDVTVSGDR
jgi:predicted esterase